MSVGMKTPGCAGGYSDLKKADGVDHNHGETEVVELVGC